MEPWLPTQKDKNSIYPTFKNTPLREIENQSFRIVLLSVLLNDISIWPQF